mgnify:CR=1 FL=1|jgi:hypothetical protein
MYIHYPIVFILTLFFVAQLRLPFFTFPIFYIFSALGFLVFILKLFSNQSNHFFLKIIFLNSIFMFIYFLCYLANLDGDFLFLREVVLFNFLSIFFLIFLDFYLRKFEVKIDFVKMTLMVVFFQMMISFFAYINPMFFSFLFGIFPLNLGLYDLDELAKMRMIVLGIPFFGSAVMGCVFLIWFAHYISKTEENKIINLILFLLVATLLVLGARTNIFGVLLSILIFFNRFSGFKVLLKSVFILALLFLVIKNFLLTDKMEEMLKFGFEFIFNYKESQAASSVNGVFDMLKIIPNDYKTWIIGDAYFKSIDGYTYYKDIDVGLLRLIFNSGLVGLIFYFYFHVFVLLNIPEDYLSRLSKVLIFLVFCVLMVKGLANIFPYIMLIYIFSNIKNQTGAVH